MKREIIGLSLALALTACGSSGGDGGTSDPSSKDGGMDSGVESGAETGADGGQEASSGEAGTDAQSDAASPCSPLSKGERMLGVDLLDTPASGDFGVNLAKGRELDIDFIALHVTWPSIETGVGTFEDPGGALGALAGVAQSEGWKLSVTLRPIDLTGKTVPVGLETARFDDPAMLARFNAMVDFVMTVVPPEVLTSLQVGNEIDGFDASGEHKDFWSHYGMFLAGVTNHVHGQYPGVRVGFTGTYHGLTEGMLHDLGVWTALAGVVDVVGVTYYPMGANFKVRPPDDVYDDFDTLAAAFPGKAILLQEVGYQTSAACGSDDAMQQAFYAHVFCAWDQHAPQFETMNIVRLNDVSRLDAEVMAGPYGLGDESFIEYLRTLGIRLQEDADKPAFIAIRDAARARDW